MVDMPMTVDNGDGRRDCHWCCDGDEWRDSNEQRDGNEHLGGNERRSNDELYAREGGSKDEVGYLDDPSSRNKSRAVFMTKFKSVKCKIAGTKASFFNYFLAYLIIKVP